MSTKYMFYLHKRLFVQEYGRTEITDIFARKILKSIARSTGARISSNRWLKTLEFLYRCTGSTADTGIKPELEEFIAKFTAALDKYQRTHGVSIPRVKMLMAYLKSHIVGGQAMLDYLAAEGDGFARRDDTQWFTDCMFRIGYVHTDCGHWVHSHMRSVLRGNNQSATAEQTVCTNCLTHLLESGERVDANGAYILAAYAADIYTRHGNFVDDRRNPRYQFDERHQRWTDGTWSPYINLIGNYHSSRSSGGFEVIQSPWFKRHRRAYGIELEVQNRSGDTLVQAGRIHDVLNPSGNRGEYCYFERDGSIGDGFEIITQPAGLDIHREKMGLFLNNDELKRGLRSHEGGSCGLHVHVGRSYLTQAQIYRVQAFLNDARNEGLIRKISRRYSNTYSRIRPEMGKLSPVGKNTGERYEALNVTGRETIEFRIFRGSLKYESVMAALEFVDALLTFCMPGQASIRDFNAIGFRRFITLYENAPDTKFLRTYLQLNQQNDAEHRLAA